MKNYKNLANVVLYGVDNISAMAFGLVGSAVLARIFGPENLGRLSVIQASAAMLVFLASLGLDHYVVRDLARKPDDGQLMGTLLVAQLAGWVLHLVLLTVATAFQGDLRQDYLIVLAVASVTLFTRAIFINLFFKAIGDPKPIAISAIVSRLAALLYLYIGHHGQFSYETMLLYLLVQSGLQCLMLAASFRRAAHFESLRFGFSAARLRELLREALPVLAAAILVPVFMQADILLLAHFLTPNEVGIYSAAARLIPQILFLGHIVATAFFPIIIEKFDQKGAEYDQHLLAVARCITLPSILAALFISLCAPWIIQLLYGARFQSSAPVLVVLSWSWVFMLPAALYSRLLVLHGLGRFELIKTVITACASLLLNSLLIPRHGHLAAAWVSVLCYFMADMALYAVFPETRFIFRIAVRALTSWFHQPRASFQTSLRLFRHSA